MSNIVLSIASFLMLGGILCVALAALLFKESDYGKTQDIYGLDSKTQSHWPILWAGAIQFGAGLVLCLIGSVVYMVEKL